MGVDNFAVILLLNYRKRRGHWIFRPCWQNGKIESPRMWHTWTSGPGGWHRDRTGFTPSSSSARSMALSPSSRMPRTMKGMSQSRNIPKRGRGMPRTGFAEVDILEYCTKKEGNEMVILLTMGVMICDKPFTFKSMRNSGKLEVCCIYAIVWRQNQFALCWVKKETGK